MKKQIFYWTLYDFANSIVVVAFFLYFSQWLVIEKQIADIWYNLIFTGSSILLVLTSPIIAIIADKKGTCLPFLRITTVSMFIALIITSLLAIYSDTTPKFVLYTAVTYMIANYFYQFSFSFYNPLLNILAPQKNHGFISGLGQAANWLGAIVGIIICIPFLNGSLHILQGTSARAQTFLPTSIVFFILALPMLVFFKEQSAQKAYKVNIKEEYKNIFKSFKEICRLPGVGRFLLAFFFFNDAILTVQNNYPIFMQQVFGVSDKLKSVLLGCILITSIIGALISGWAADKYGAKRSLIFILVGWAILFPLLGLINNFNIFTILTIILGFLYGSTWTVTRTVMANLAPKNNLNHIFSYYTLSERFATFVGPITWGIITTSFVHIGSSRYKIAITTLTIFILLGLFIAKDLPNLEGSQT